MNGAVSFRGWMDGLVDFLVTAGAVGIGVGRFINVVVAFGLSFVVVIVIVVIAIFVPTGIVVVVTAAVFFFRHLGS